MRLLILLVLVSVVSCRATTETPVTKQSTPASLDMPNAIDFGVVDTGSFKDTTLDIFNPGTETLHVLDQHFSSPFFSVDSTTFDIIGRVTHSLKFHYTSSDLNEHSATDTIVTNVNRYTVQLHGKGSIPSDANDLLVAGTPNGIFLSSDRGYTWAPTSTIPVSGAQLLQVLAFKGAIYVRTSNNLYCSTDLGRSWTTLNVPNTDVIAMEAFDSVMLIADGSADIYASTDGNDWRSSYVSGAILCFAKMSDSNRYYAGGTYLYASSTSGRQWQDVNSDLGNISTLGYHSPYIFAGADNGGIYRLNESSFSQWQADSSGIPPQSRYYNFLATNSGLFMLSSGGLLRSLDNGHKWFLLSASNFPVNDLTVSSVLKAVHGQIILGCDNGIYRSVDNGMTWAPSSSGLTNKQVNCIAIMHRP